MSCLYDIIALWLLSFQLLNPDPLDNYTELTSHADTNGSLWFVTANTSTSSECSIVLIIIRARYYYGSFTLLNVHTINDENWIIILRGLFFFTLHTFLSCLHFSHGSWTDCSSMSYIWIGLYLCVDNILFHLDVFSVHLILVIISSLL